MRFPLPVARYACEIAHKLLTFALQTPQRIVLVVLFMRVPALAGSAPSQNIEFFSPGQPVHSAFFWSLGDVFELLAHARLACRIHALSKILIIMVLHKMTAETF